MMLGTVLKISSTIVVDGGLTADSASIEIYDPDGADALESSGDGVMEQDSSGGDVWEFIFQSDAAGTEGVYQYVISAVSGIYTAQSWGSFELDAKPEA